MHGFMLFCPSLLRLVTALAQLVLFSSLLNQSVVVAESLMYSFVDSAW
jgi:hypothetical protein